MRSPIISIIIPCYDDAAVLENCLDALINQTVVAAGGLLELVVVLNGCTDRSAEVVQTTAQAAVGRPVRIRVVRLPRPSKSAALNHGDAVASAPYRMYLDADVICDVHLVEALLNVLNTAEPRYATGTIAIAPTRSWVTAAYGRIWHKLVMRDVNGIGLYAVNPRARSRWTSFPAIHSDDKFVRLNFGPAERIRVPAVYRWPLPEGWMRLLRVRLRWTEGNLEIERLYPELARRHTRSRRPFTYLPLVLLNPLSFAVFFSVYVVCWLIARGDVETETTSWQRAR